MDYIKISNALGEYYLKADVVYYKSRPHLYKQEQVRQFDMPDVEEFIQFLKEYEQPNNPPPKYRR